MRTLTFIYNTTEDDKPYIKNVLESAGYEDAGIVARRNKNECLIIIKDDIVNSFYWYNNENFEPIYHSDIVHKFDNFNQFERYLKLNKLVKKL